jgi:hypothetical protein
MDLCDASLYRKIMGFMGEEQNLAKVVGLYLKDEELVEHTFFSLAYRDGDEIGMFESVHNYLVENGCNLLTSDNEDCYYRALFSVLRTTVLGEANRSHKQEMAEIYFAVKDTIADDSLRIIGAKKDLNFEYRLFKT